MIRAARDVVGEKVHVAKKSWVVQQILEPINEKKYKKKLNTRWVRRKF